TRALACVVSGAGPLAVGSARWRWAALLGASWPSWGRHRDDIARSPRGLWRALAACQIGSTLSRRARFEKAVRSPSTSLVATFTPRAIAALLLAVAIGIPASGCDKMKATTDRALVSLSLKPACPEPVEGRAVGAESPELAVSCFRK